MPLFNPIIFPQLLLLLLFILQPNCSICTPSSQLATLHCSVKSFLYPSAPPLKNRPKKTHQILTRTMRRGYHICITSLLFFLLISQSISARLLPTNQASSSSFLTTNADEDVASLMGLEECNEKDEACVQRRMIAEAHLDYIYTQHHKPKGSP